MEPREFTNEIISNRQHFTHHKEFKYSIRMPIPETSSRVVLYPYTRALDSFVAKLAKQLKSQKRKFRSGGEGEGYDNIRGKYIERSIIAYTLDNNEITQKIIWITQ